MTQPDSTSPNHASKPAPDTGAASSPVSPQGPAVQAFLAAQQTPHPHRIPRWLERAELFLRVVVRMYIGLAVSYAPWSHTFWDQNPLFLRFPTLGIVAANGAVRGIITGLGLLNLWFAFQDLLRRRSRSE